MNQKSLDKKKTEPKKLEWEKEFRKFYYYSNNLGAFDWTFEATPFFIETFISKTIQSLIQSTKEETIRKVLELECLKNEKEPKKEMFDYSEDKERYRNQLRNQIKEQLNSLLKE